MTTPAGTPPPDRDGYGWRRQVRETWHDLVHWWELRRGSRAADARGLAGDVGAKASGMARAYLRHRRDRLRRRT